MQRFAADTPAAATMTASRYLPSFKSARKCRAHFYTKQDLRELH
jgi:hypothetical protein